MKSEPTNYVSADRLTFVDGLRAIAALSVFGFHVSALVHPALGAPLSYGWLGVPVFFAISGFVIARSTSSFAESITLRHVGNFLVKRAVRIVPTYWTSLLVVLLTLVAAKFFLTAHAADFPGLERILAHGFFLQDILSYRNFLDVTWSLCIEMQFYAFFVLLLFGLHCIAPKLGVTKLRNVNWNVISACIFGLLLATNILAIRYHPAACRPWLIAHWNQFFYGILALGVVRRNVSVVWFVPLGAMVAFLLSHSFDFLSDAVALVTAVAVVLSSRISLVATCLDAFWIQHFASLSYSFYLLHSLVLARTVRLMSHLGVESFYLGWVVPVIGFALSLGAAEILFRFVERPSMKLASRFR